MLHMYHQCQSGLLQQEHGHHDGSWLFGDAPGNPTALRPLASTNLNNICIVIFVMLSLSKLSDLSFNITFAGRRPCHRWSTVQFMGLACTWNYETLCPASRGQQEARFSERGQQACSALALLEPCLKRNRAKHVEP